VERVVDNADGDSQSALRRLIPLTGDDAQEGGARNSSATRSAPDSASRFQPDCEAVKASSAVQQLHFDGLFARMSALIDWDGTRSAIAARVAASKIGDGRPDPPN
jgi:hypothetical protein